MLRSVLPFDEDTSSSDQAAISATKHGKIAALCGDAEAQAAVEPDLHLLRAQAVDFRRVVRVKMADEADLKQALVAARMLNKFVVDLEDWASCTDVAFTSAVAQLESGVMA